MQSLIRFITTLETLGPSLAFVIANTDNQTAETNCELVLCPVRRQEAHHLPARPAAAALVVAKVQGTAKGAQKNMHHRGWRHSRAS